jgi:hypothetical protein
LLAFAASGDAFIQAKYDQSGNGYHQINNTNLSQPRIVVAGVVNLKNNRPSALFSGLQFLSTANWGSSNMFGGVPSTINLVGNSTAFSDQDFLSYGNSVALGLRGIGGGNVGRNDWRSMTGVDINNTAVSFQTFATVTNTYGSGSSALYTQGVLRGTSSGFEDTPLTELYLGQRSNNSSWAHGNISEAWIFPDSLPSSDLTTLHQNQSSYYGITVP